MKAAEFARALVVDRSPLEVLGFNPYYQRLSGLHRGQPTVNGRPCFDLASNDYLGLASDERVHEAMRVAIREYGASMCGTPIAAGYARILADLETELARFVGLESAVVLPSCYQANVALFPAIATPQDVILVDRAAHASLVQGVRAVGCKVRPFLHNDLAHLEQQLAAAAPARHVFVVTESVFSTEGSVAPLADVVELCRRYDAIPVVDDSHGLGVLGRGGRGILEAQDLTRYPGLYTASLGKALANAGGMIAGAQSLIDALRYSCAGLIYSTALPPACVGGLRSVLEIITREFDRLGARMWSNHRRLVDKLQQRGFALRPAAAPIAAIQCASPQETLTWARDFFEQRLFATPFVPPAVPPGEGVLRLIVGAKLDETGMAGVLGALDQITSGKRL
jgi:7-keto-8-aminopelargonate synthetase-like enzyme